MKQKSKFRRFWNLDHRKSDGFTLVELIVVIAILAVLAGVSVPAYNGYIEKAEKAADEKLLAAVNTAFASACMEGNVDVENVTEASVAIIDKKVHGLSTVTATETETSAKADINVISPAFDRYYEGNEDAIFKADVVNSLIWNETEKKFTISEEATSMRLSVNGKLVTVSKEDMAKILASTFADMGYSGVAKAINNVSKSGKTLAAVAGGLGMLDRLTNAMIANGLISSDKATQMQNALGFGSAIGGLLDPDKKAAYNAAINESSNGLQMVTAKYLSGATDAQVMELLGPNYKFTDSSSMLSSMTDSGGTKTVSAAALQYALAESFASNEAAKGEQGQKITYVTKEWDGSLNWGFGGYKDVEKTVSVSEFLASDYAADDPIKALSMVQATGGYNNYTTTEQYTNDINGFVGTMGLLGDNLGTVNKDGSVKTEGAINPGDYLTGGINGNDAEDVLTEVLGP